MKKIYKLLFQHLGKHYFFYLIIVSIFIVGISSYHRFLNNRDYIVEYEQTCNPNIEICFVGCDDDNCSQKHYYVKIQKYAFNLYAECGEDITNCELAKRCYSGDHKCSVIYCSLETKESNTCSDPKNYPGIQNVDFNSINNNKNDL